MPSANFFIGYDLSMKSFDTYVLPLLKNQGYSAEDRISVVHKIPDTRFGGTSMLVSIVGEGDSEKGVNEALVKAGEQADGKTTQKYQFSGTKRDNKYGGFFEVIGIYANDKTASDIFPMLAQKYLIEELESKVDAVAQELKSLLDTKLSEL